MKRDTRDAALDDELRAHLAMAVADRIARGESPEEAIAGARREFGNVGHVKEVTREMWGSVWIERLVQDVQYAVRSLRRAPGFAIVATLTLALGIGINTAMFTVMNGVLLRPLPFPDADRLFVASYSPPRGPFSQGTGMWDVHYLQFARANTIFDHVTTFSTPGVTLTGTGEPARLVAGAVTPDFFSVFGTRPAIGRVFGPRDADDGQDKIVILSDALWRARFGADPHVLGTSVTIDGTRRTIVGVMPPTFVFPAQTDLWFPTEIKTNPHQIMSRLVVGHLARGMTPKQAQLAFASLAAHLDTPDDIDRKTLTAALIPLKDVVVGDARRPLFIFASAVVVVLLIACANVANLLLMRVASRDREMAVRAAIGAGRMRLIRQLLTETFVISAFGTILGIALSSAGVRVLLALAPTNAIPRADGVHVDIRVLAFTVGLSLITALICGLVPALHATEDRLRASLSAGARSVTLGHGRIRSVLVIAEVALALVLLTSAGLLLRSFHHMRTVDLGFQPDNVSLVTVDLPDNAYTAAVAMREFHRRVTENLARIPGVDAAGAVNWLPLGGGLIAGDFHIENGPKLPPGYMADKVMVSPDYFRAMRLPIERGRAFTSRDDASAPGVVIISHSIAQRFWPNGDAVGKRLSVADKPTASDWLTIVGVVGDVVQQGVTTAPDAALYQPIEQTDHTFFLSHATFVVRPTAGNSAQAELIAPAMRRVVREADATLPLSSITTMNDLIASTTIEPLFQTRLLATFSALALLLAVVGIYGVLAYGVAQRLREIGIRVALGAAANDVTRMVLRRTAALTLPGVVVGALVSVATTRVLAKLLFGVSPTDPMTFAAVAVLLIAAAVLASIVPARRASRVDPLVALRGE